MITDPDNDSIPANTARGASAADRMPVEEYSAERKAEFLLSNAVDEQDYAWAVREVRKLGIDPEAVLHERREPNEEWTRSSSTQGAVPGLLWESRNRQTMVTSREGQPDGANFGPAGFASARRARPVNRKCLHGHWPIPGLVTVAILVCSDRSPMKQMRSRDSCRG